MSHERCKSDREGESSHDFPYVWNLKEIDKNELAYKAVANSLELANGHMVVRRKVGRKSVVLDF